MWRTTTKERLYEELGNAAEIPASPLPDVGQSASNPSPIYAQVNLAEKREGRQLRGRLGGEMPRWGRRTSRR